LFFWPLLFSIPGPAFQKHPQLTARPRRDIRQLKKTIYTPSQAALAGEAIVIGRSPERPLYVLWLS
jgi:hypothetical protein